MEPDLESTAAGASLAPLMAQAEQCLNAGDSHEAVRLWLDIASILGAATPEYVYHRLSAAYARIQDGFGGTSQENQIGGDCPKHEILAWLHQRLEPSLYLEIGVDRGVSLALARGRAIGVDARPDLNLAVPLSDQTRLVSLSSDAFFRQEADSLLRSPPDLVFIDGMHLFEFALRDFMNVERYASPATLVVIDDIFPGHPAQASRRPRTNYWTGDVWKLHQILSDYRPDLTLLALNAAGTGLLLVAGLDPASHLLSHHYDLIVQRFGAIAEPPPEVLTRRAALPSRHPGVDRVLTVLTKARQEGWSVEQVHERLGSALAT